LASAEFFRAASHSRYAVSKFIRELNAEVAQAANTLHGYDIEAFRNAYSA